MLCKAFQDTQITTNRKGICNLLNTHQFIYRSLQNAGIQNRSPFSIRQLIEIWYSSKGNPEQLRTCCIDSVNNMQKPAFGFSSTAVFSVFAAISLSLLILLTPKTATTSKSTLKTNSILEVKTLPWHDIEIESPSLPLTSDYLIAAYQPEIAPEEKQLESIAATPWIMKQPDSSYALQLLSVSKTSNLINFCKKHNICEQSALYTTEVNGKQLVRLIYGSYTNHKAAKIAKNNLPDSLKGIKSWARSFRQIKTEL